MADILASVGTRKTPQREKARPDQVKNAAGGYVFQVGDEERLHRFLTLGTDGPSYYTSAKELTRANAEVVFRMAANKPDQLINEILAISEAGRAPKNKQAIFALAIAASADDVATRQKALAIMHRVCRTGTMVFQFNKYVEQFRGRGPTLNRAIGNWYKLKPVDKLAYQVTKYRAREDWTHRDLLRLVKGHAGKSGEISSERDALLGWIAKGDESRIRPAWNDGGPSDFHTDGSLAIVVDYLDLKGLGKKDGAKAAEIIGRGHGVSWEMLPDALVNDPTTWEAMLAQGMPQTALMRQLNRLTTVFGPTGSWVGPVATQIQDQERLVKGRVHPINVLLAMRVYAQGHNVPRKGAKMRSWPVCTPIVDAMDAGFYNAFPAVEPTGKRRLLALDVSGSMHMAQIGDLFITPREVSSALALVAMATEPGTEIIGFSGTGRQQSGWGPGLNGRRVEFNNTGKGEPIRLDISPRRRLDDVIRYTSDLPYGDTDCALPFTWAQKHGHDFDSVEIYTDNESWSGPIHVHQAAKSYREHVGHDVKLIGVAMTATDYSIVDPKDSSGLNVSGFDSSVPTLVNDFIAGRI